MRYESDDGRIVELLWNSRDGVTPFMIVAKDGVTTLRHMLWGRDEYRPHHQLQPGDRYFGALTREKAIEYAAKHLDSCIGTEYELQGQQREAMHSKLVADFLANPCPDTITFTGEEVAHG